jgi:hypothetical protein
MLLKCYRKQPHKAPSCAYRFTALNLSCIPTRHRSKPDWAFRVTPLYSGPTHILVASRHGATILYHGHTMLGHLWTRPVLLASQSHEHKGYLISVDLIGFPPSPTTGKQFILDLSFLKLLSRSYYGGNAQKTQVLGGDQRSSANSHTC